MTAFDYSRSQQTANRLIARFGQSGTLRRPVTSGAAYNPTVGTPLDYAATFAVMDYTNHDIDGTRIRATDKHVYLAKASLAIEPSTSDKLLIGGVEHAIVTINPFSPGGTVVLYDMQVRR